MQPGEQVAMRDEEAMRERWMRTDRFAATKGDPVKANVSGDIEASPLRSRDEIQQAITAQRSLAVLSPEELRLANGLPKEALPILGMIS
eukprot:1633517-Karenia_brevis.AAC.1